MRQDAIALRRFYASQLGSAAARILGDRIRDLWGDGKGLTILGLGYALPLLEAFSPASARIMAAVPFEHGQVYWDPSGRGNAAVAVGDLRLPFPDGLFDRLILLHGIEETGDPRAYLREVWRVTAPEGRVLIAAANRSGLWSRATHTPFGQGRPWTRNQLSTLLATGLFQVTASASALFMPPADLRLVTAAAEGWEQMGQIFAPGLGGVVMVEAVKRLYAPPGGGSPSPVTDRISLPRPVSAARRNEY